MPSKQALACKHAMMVRDVCGDWWNMWCLMCDMRGMGAFINASALPQAPLVLGFDMTDKVKMDRVWPVGVLTLDLLFGWVFCLDGVRSTARTAHTTRTPHVAIVEYAAWRTCGKQAKCRLGCHWPIVERVPCV